MNSQQLHAEIVALEARLAPQIAELDALRQRHRDALSREWIAANNVTAANLVRSDGNAAPWFGIASEFGNWLRATGCTARWAEWNGRIYSCAEIMAGKLAREAPGMVEHVPPDAPQQTSEKGMA